MTSLVLADTARQWVLVIDPSDAQGAGLARYAAAMQLYRFGEISDEALELYRALSKQPNTFHPDRSSHVIRALVAAIEAYLDAVAPGQFAGVRNGIARWKLGSVTIPSARQLPACRYLDDVLPTLSDPLASALRQAATLLHWTTYDAYPIADIGEAFAKGHAFASVMGEQAPLFADDFDLGLFVIAPKVLYRDHHHKAPELYVPLTGPHGWRFQPDSPFVEKPAHEPVWNEPHTPHATLTGTVPFLSLFCWTRDVSAPAKVVPASDWRLHEAVAG